MSTSRCEFTCLQRQIPRTRTSIQATGPDYCTILIHGHVAVRLQYELVDDMDRFSTHPATDSHVYTYCGTHTPEQHTHAHTQPLATQSISACYTKNRIRSHGRRVTAYSIGITRQHAVALTLPDMHCLENLVWKSAQLSLWIKPIVRNDSGTLWSTILSYKIGVQHTDTDKDADTNTQTKT